MDPTLSSHPRHITHCIYLIYSKSILLPIVGIDINFFLNFLIGYSALRTSRCWKNTSGKNNSQDTRIQAGMLHIKKVKGYLLSRDSYGIEISNFPG